MFKLFFYATAPVDYELHFVPTFLIT